MEIIADANVFLSVILNEPQRQLLIRMTLDSEILGPEILPFEIGNALSAMYKRRRLDTNQCLRVLEQFNKIPVRLVSVDIEQSLRIALEHNLYAYDAYYLEVAQRLNKPLMTLDKRMKDAGINLGLTILEE